MLSCDVQQGSVSSMGHLNFNKRNYGSREQMQLVLSSDKKITTWKQELNQKYVPVYKKMQTTGTEKMFLEEEE